MVKTWPALGSWMAIRGVLWERIREFCRIGEMRRVKSALSVKEGKGLELSEYKNIWELEDTHWWYVSTHRAILGELGRLLPKSKVLDAGCRRGGLFVRTNASKSWAWMCFRTT